MSIEEYAKNAEKKKDKTITDLLAIEFYKKFILKGDIKNDK